MVLRPRNISTSIIIRTPCSPLSFILQPGKLYELDERFHRRYVEAGSGPRLMSLHEAVKPQAERYIRIGTLILFSGTALFSYAVVQQSSSKLVTHFVVELSQNLYFVGLVLTYILWAAVMKMRETRTRLIQLVLSMGVYFSLFAANFALQNLYQSRGNFFEFLTPLFGCFLPLSWAYTFWHLPEDARIVPSRLAVVPR